MQKTIGFKDISYIQLQGSYYKKINLLLTSYVAPNNMDIVKEACEISLQNHMEELKTCSCERLNEIYNKYKADIQTIQAILVEDYLPLTEAQKRYVEFIKQENRVFQITFDENKKFLGSETSKMYEKLQQQKHDYLERSLSLIFDLKDDKIPKIQRQQCVDGFNYICGIKKQYNRIRIRQCDKLISKDLNTPEHWIASDKYAQLMEEIKRYNQYLLMLKKATWLIKNLSAEEIQDKSQELQEKLESQSESYKQLKPSRADIEIETIKYFQTVNIEYYQTRIEELRAERE